MRHVYVYGVVRAPSPRGVDAGVAGPRSGRSSTAAWRRSSATSPGDRSSAAREVRAHWRVLEAVAAEATVLPVRFGTVMAGERRRRRQLLEPRPTSSRRCSRARRARPARGQGRLRRGGAPARVVARLRRIAQLRERVRGCPRRPATTTGSGSASSWPPRSTAAASATAGGARAARAPTRRPRGQRAGRAANGVQPRVPRRARRGRRVRRAGARWPRRSASALKLRYVGPLPPYSFVDDEWARCRHGPDHRAAHASARAPCAARSGSPSGSRSRPSASTTTSGRSSAELLEIEEARAAGEIDERELDAVEDALIERLLETAASRGGGLMAGRNRSTAARSSASERAEAALATVEGADGLRAGGGHRPRVGRRASGCHRRRAGADAHPEHDRRDRRPTWCSSTSGGTLRGYKRTRRYLRGQAREA